MGGDLFACAAPARRRLAAPTRSRRSSPPFAPKAKRVIYLHMSGSPPQHDLFDYKPKLVEMNGQPCPDSFLKGERFAFIKGHPKCLGTPHKFKQYGKSGHVDERPASRTSPGTPTTSRS